MHPRKCAFFVNILSADYVTLVGTSLLQKRHQRRVRPNRLQQQHRSRSLRNRRRCKYKPRPKNLYRHQRRQLHQLLLHLRLRHLSAPKVCSSQRFHSKLNTTHNPLYRFLHPRPQVSNPLLMHTNLILAFPLPSRNLPFLPKSPLNRNHPLPHRTSHRTHIIFLPLLHHCPRSSCLSKHRHNRKAACFRTVNIILSMASLRTSIN